MSEIVNLLENRSDLEYKKRKEKKGEKREEFEKEIRKVEDKLEDEVSGISEPILNGDSEIIVNEAIAIGKYLSNNLSTSQIRNIFSDTKQLTLKEFNKDELNLLRPKLAYAAGRHGGGVRDLQSILDPLIERVVNSNDPLASKRFHDFFEAILAYHRYYGGKD